MNGFVECSVSFFLFKKKTVLGSNGGKQWINGGKDNVECGHCMCVLVVVIHLSWMRAINVGSEHV